MTANEKIEKAIELYYETFGAGAKLPVFEKCFVLKDVDGEWVELNDQDGSQLALIELVSEKKHQ